MQINYWILKATIEPIAKEDIGTRAPKARTLNDIKRAGLVEPRAPTLVYFAHRDGHIFSPVKIGISNAPVHRMGGIENQIEREYGVIWRLNVLATLRGFTNLENYLHYAFQALNLFGEWFSPGIELMSLIYSVDAESCLSCGDLARDPQEEVRICDPCSRNSMQVDNAISEYGERRHPGQDHKVVQNLDMDIVRRLLPHGWRDKIPGKNTP